MASSLAALTSRRGPPKDGLCPYPFIDVPAIGYSQAVINSLGLLVAFLLLGMVFLAAARLLSRRALAS